jgi:hypothetical protein
VIYTGYFAQAHTCFEAGLVLLSIANLLCHEKLPEGYTKNIVEICDLEPGKKFCHRHIISAFLKSGDFECREYLVHKQ